MTLPRALLIGLLGSSTAWAQLPEGIVNTQQGDDVPPTPEESLDLIDLPEGFEISLFAGEPDVAQPIAIQYDDRGRLWVLESFSYIEWKRTGKDRLLIFEDTDNDGRFDKRTVFWDQGNHTSGFTLGFGGVWLCDAPELLFIPDTDRDDVPDSKPTVLLDGWATDAEHNFFNGLTWGPDGWLYGRHGIKKPSKVGKPGAPESERVDLSCSIWRFHPTREVFEVWAEGTVNPWGLDWNEEGEGFIHTSVIDHLWHLVPGARYKRSTGRSAALPESHSYELMEATSDHRHWAGGQTERRQESGHDDAGGGHSHSGLVIYQSDAWPEVYRGQAFFSNILGQRINMDALQPTETAYVATHGADFLKARSPWFRAVDLKQGPYGEVAMAEWTDLGECHDRDGIHRSSGRIYQIWHGDRADRTTFDLANESTADLLDLLTHENAWWRRQALRLLHERASAGQSIPDEWESTLRERAMKGSVRDAITAIQALHLAVPFEDWFERIYEAAHNTPEGRAAIRRHLMTLSMTEHTPDQERIAWFEESVVKETDPTVQYRMAALLQRIPLEHRWTSAELLAQVTFPDNDPNPARMRWYGIEPLVAENPSRAAALALRLNHPFLSQSISRRIVSLGSLSILLEALHDQKTPETSVSAVLEGILAALPSQPAMPDSWPTIYQTLKERNDPTIQRQIFRLAHRFGDPRAEREMLALVLDTSASPIDREEFMGLLVTSQSKALAKHIPALTADPLLGAQAIRAISVFPTTQSASFLLKLLENSSDRSAIYETLASRKSFANALIAAVVEGNVNPEDLPAYITRQLTSVGTPPPHFSQIMKIDIHDAERKAAMISTWKRRLNQDYLSQGSPQEGREVFRKVCSACHVLYDEGGLIGPDLTGSGRADLDYFLINTLFPSEDVSDDYRLVTLTLADGRSLTGNVIEENPEVITFRQVGQIERIDASQITGRVVSDQSLMPAGILDSLTREDVRDLFTYLRTKAPL